MHSKSFFTRTTLITLPTVIAAILFTSWQAVAQSPPTQETKTWQDLGFTRLPEGLSTDAIPLFEGLNKARGTWSFEGEITDGETATPVKGSVQITGEPKRGMLPAWKVIWGWPADDPTQVLHDSIMASPNATGFDLMLFRIGPVAKPKAGEATPKVRPIVFRGKWDLENRKIAWVESDLPGRLTRQPAKQDASRPKQSFDMVVGVDGKISIENGKHTSPGQLLIGQALTRTGEPPEEPVTLTGEHRFQTVAEILDPRIKPSLPPQAKEISLLSERGGHFARYKVSEADFMAFLDELWEAKQDSSAHKRDEMSGEGEPAKREWMARAFKAAGWNPLKNATTYYSPSKPSGAMTTYYYDRDAGIAYHDTGYW